MLTLALLLRGRGYHTAAIGKWHLGLGWVARSGFTPSTTTENQVEWIDYARPVMGGPTALGFDRFFGIPASLDMPRLPGVPFSDPGFYRPEIVEGEAGNSAQVGIHCYSSDDLCNWSRRTADDVGGRGPAEDPAPALASRAAWVFDKGNFLARVRAWPRSRASSRSPFPR